MVQPDKDKILDKALSIAGERGWNALTLEGVARACDVPLTDFRRTYRSKRGLLEAIVDRFERTAADSVDEEARDPDLPVPERLFDVLMTRFELLQEHRAGYLAILKAARTDPVMALKGAIRLHPAMGNSLKLAGLPADGPVGCLRRKVLAALYLSVIEVWSRDESEDLGPTMSALDKRLKRLDGLVASTCIGRKSAPRESAVTNA